MKKILKTLLFTLALGAVSSVFAAGSLGYGFLWGGDFGGGYEGEYSYTTGSYYNPTTVHEKFTESTPRYGWGYYMFIDARYIEISTGFLFTGNKWKYEYQSSEYGNYDYEEEISTKSFNLQLLAKIPFEVSPDVNVFPLFGVSWDIALRLKDEDDEKFDDPTDWSAFWFKFGAGFSVPLNDELVLQGSALYGIRTKNKLENDVEDEDDDVSARLGHGLTLRVGIGFNF